MPNYRGKRRASRRSIFSRLKSARVRAILSLGIVLGFGAVGTYAYWTDTATISSAQFSAGTIDLRLNGHQGTTEDPAVFPTTLGMSDMVPGSSVAAMLPVQNKSLGSKITYTMKGRATGTLGAALTLKVFSEGSASNSPGGVGTCSGTQIYGGPNGLLLSNVDAAILNERPNPSLLPQNGVENLCFLVGLPTGADNTLQSQTSKATFTFLATQVAPS